MPKFHNNEINSNSNNKDNDEFNADNSETETIDSLNMEPKETNKCTWQIGQLAWARVGNFPYWPCVVTLDPATNTFHKSRCHARCTLIMIHVQYFGDNGKHSWVSSNAMLPFTSLNDFKKLSEIAIGETKRKDNKNAFIIKPSLKSKWEGAVEEALESQQMTLEDRIKFFAPARDLKFGKSKTNVENDKAEKRKQSIETTEPISKRSRQDSPAESILSTKTVETEKESEKLETETPPTSPFSDQNENTMKPKSVIKTDYDEKGIFEVYYEKNKDMLEDEYPDATEEDIKKYLRKTWNNMNSSFRKKYRSYITPENSIKSRESSSDNDDSLIEDKEPTKERRRSKLKVDKIEKVEKIEKTDKEESIITETKRSKPYNLFRGIKSEKVCQICEKTGKLTRCKGPCYSYFHLSCVKPGESSPEHSCDESSMDEKFVDNYEEHKKRNSKSNGKTEEPEDETFKCIDCLSGVAPACFICNEREGDRIRCSSFTCGKHYHSACLKSWPQSHWQGARLTCPYHICHTCSSDNPQDGHPRTPNEKLARCVRCPSSYHASASCLPAGSVIITGSQIICPKHYKAPNPPSNANWCFLCAQGGKLICCDTCPTSFHLECLGIDAPDDAFICEDCETGRLPLYGEIVWVKLGHCRWWPSRICYPNEIPEEITDLPHSPGKFCVMFLGSNDYHWVHRGRAFLYQDGDANIKPPNSKSVKNDVFKKALEEANDYYLRLKTERTAKDYYHRDLKPPPYKKLKVNKPVGNVKAPEIESIVACDCSPDSENPCAPGTDCLNRILLVECSPGTCPAGSKCENQAFVQRQYPTLEPFHTIERGWGLRALEPIEKGQFIIEYVGEVIDDAEYKRRLHRKKESKNENFYFLTIDNNRTIDAEPKGNLSRFMNHSCLPNCETQKWTVNGDTRIGLFALQDINIGEELTFNYNLASDGETRKPCLCGAPNCSGFIGLKASKQQFNLNPPKKMKRHKFLKRFMRNGKYCWNCGLKISTDDEFFTCKQRTCNKKYHRTCVSVEDTESPFECPWHFCIECSRRTSARCSYCSRAYCQGHLDGNLFESNDKTGFVCKDHEYSDSPKSSGEDYSDIDTETDKERCSTRSSSPVTTEKGTSRESSPRVAIVEVDFNTEESEDSQIEDETENKAMNASHTDKTLKTWKRRKSQESTPKKREDKIHSQILSNLTRSQLEAIIGGTL